MIGFQVAGAADTANISEVDLHVLQEWRKGAVALKRSRVEMVIRDCALALVDQHIGPIFRDDGGADNLSGCRGEDEAVGRLGRAQAILGNLHHNNVYSSSVPLSRCSTRMSCQSLPPRERA